MATPPYTKRAESSSSPTEDSAKKRRKGATRLSCAECRRLKLRCDRNIPCGSCQKRGCSAICPDGSLTTGQGNRFVLASTQELHEKISELANRVRDLEDALRSSHAQLTPDGHPLLTEELLRIKAPLQREPSGARTPSAFPNVKEEEHNPDVVDAFGSLSISVSGKANYFGSVANSWYFLQNEYPDEEDDDEPSHMASLQTLLPPEVLSRSSNFPITPANPGNAEFDAMQLQSLFWYLPPIEKATELRQLFYRNAAWMYNPISSEAFMEEVFAQFYDPNAQPPTDDPILSHRLALMFIVLAIGTVIDTNLPAYNLEAEKYHQLARAALFQNGLFDEPTINAVQALYLMSYYLFLADRQGRGSGTRWAIMGLAVKLAQSIGLHRDSGRWQVDPKETQRRRELFWELYTYDSWQCFTIGRPPSFSLAHIDCKMPYESECSDEHAFHAWKHRFASECMSVVHDQAFGAKNPTYATVLLLDRKLRGFPVPPILQVAGFGQSETRPGGFPPETVMLILQRHIVLAIRETNLLYLHRSFFARAMNDHPKDPLGSPYGTSVIAAYRSAGSLVALMRNLHTQLQHLSERIWFLWAHMFSCSIVLGSIVTRCPSMSLAPSALVQLDSACELFAKAASGFHAQKVLGVMLRLQERAHASLAEHQSGMQYPAAVSIPMNPTVDDELATLGGKTRLLAKKEPPETPLLNTNLALQMSPQMMNPVVPLPLSPTSGQPPVHPSVVEYLRTFAHTPTTGAPPPMPPTSLAPQQLHQPHHSFSDPLFNMQSMPGTFMPEEMNLYNQDVHSHSRSNSISHPPPLDMSDPNLFPQYFPVYDYGPADPSYSMMSMDPVMGNTNGNQMVYQRTSLTPELNMHTTWTDFVSGMGMAN